MQSSNEINQGAAIYRRLLTYVRHYKLIFAVACIGLIVSAITDTSIAAILKPLIDGGLVAHDPFWIQWIPVFLLLLALVRGIGTFSASFLMNWIGRHVIMALRRQLFTKFMLLPSPFYDNHNIGQLMSKMSYDVEQVAQATTQAVTVVIRDSLTIIGLLAWMFYLNWKLSLSFLLISPLMVLLILSVNKRFRRISTNIQNSMGDVSHVTEEIISGQRIIKIFGGHHYETGRFAQINERNRSQHMKLVATREASLQLIQIIVACGLSIIIYLATLPIVIDSISAGTFMSLVAAMMMLLSPVKRLTMVNAEIQRAIAAAHSIFNLLDSEQEQDKGVKILPQVRGKVEYHQVSFHYGLGETAALNDINLSIKPGQTVAFVGQSGSGKTTLVNMLPRFYDPTQGSITLDGHDIKTLKLDNLRQHIALVGQEVVLFNDTIANNICYGCTGTAGEQEIIAAAEAAHAMEFIRQLPAGLNTVVGEKGMLLSGGQRQRLAIARALYKDAPILILDEATSALDSESEKHIQAALERLISNRTTLVIAHRLSTIQQADQIIVLHQGSIVEQGRHEDLLARGDYYARLYQTQFQGQSG